MVKLQPPSRGISTPNLSLLRARQDPSWRELLRFCAARGAFRGAGSDVVAAVMRDGGADDGDGSLFGLGNALADRSAPAGGSPLTSQQAAVSRLRRRAASMHASDESVAPCCALLVALPPAAAAFPPAVDRCHLAQRALLWTPTSTALLSVPHAACVD